MAKAENPVCSFCPLVGEPGYILSKGTPCQDEAIRNCSRLLGESTIPKRVESGIAYHLDGDLSSWKRKRYKDR